MVKNTLTKPLRITSHSCSKPSEGLNHAAKHWSIVSNGVNDKGVALIIALILLLILTMIGISAITTTTFETSISGNERLGMDAFYASEAGIQMGLNRIPNTNPINRTKLGRDSHYWSGSPQDRNSPKPLKPFGLYAKGGFDSTWQFERFQINATGESFEATKEIEVQVSYGPFPGGTGYNN